MTGDVSPAPAPQAAPALDEEPATAALPSLTVPSGSMKRVPFDTMTRVVTGNPDIADVTIVSENEILLHGNTPGETDLVVWDGSGVHTYRVVVASQAMPAVKLTVQLVELLRTASHELGVDWMDSITVTETPFEALGPENISIAARTGEAWRIGALSRTGGSATLNMLVERGKARILAEPRLVSSSGQEATTFVGVEVPVVTANSVSQGVVTQNIEFKKTGVELKFTPTVLEDRHSIRIPVAAKVSSIDTAQAITVSGIRVPGFRIRETQTDIVTDDGQPIVISGLPQDEERKNLSQVPGLGSLPVVGSLFRTTEFVGGQTDLIIIVTPRLREETQLAADRSAAVELAVSSARIPEMVRKE
jgi:pilus assembly protein CpaC